MGLLVDWFGANACFLLDGLSFFFSAAMVMTLAIRPVRSGAARAASTVMDSMREGFGFIFTHSAISFVFLFMTAGMFGLRCFGALLSVYVRDILASKTALFGLLSTLIGVGMIAGTHSLTRFARKASKEYLVVCGLEGMGVAVLITAVFGTIATTALGMLTLGFSAAFVMTPAQTLLQQETPHELLGRVTSSLMSLLCISQVLALFVAGPVASRLGIRNLYFGSAAMLLAIGAVGLARLRAVRVEPARVPAD
jgi:predicted MFS family arabinose efflux permease